MSSAVTRRSFVARAGAGAGLVLGGVPVWADAQSPRRRVIPYARGGAFPEGVAAGEPGTNSIILWTRLGGGFRSDRRVTIEVATDPGFSRVVYRRPAVARAAHDHTIKAVLRGRGLRPDQRYYYRFETRDVESPVGRFQTLRPADSREPVRIAFFSCQDYQAGYYGAHAALAARDDLDMVVCLGDYIYERNFYDGPRQDRLGANRDGEVQTIGEYRDKYKLYRSDADLRAMHQSHAFLATWDDHEVEDNYAGRNRPGEETQDPRVSFAERRRNAYLAYSEFMPFRLLSPAGQRVYRSLRLGRQAELFILDERQYRDDQPCGDQFFVPCPEAEAPGRRFLGDEQKAWLKRGLEGSSANWKLIGNQLMIMSLDSAPGQPIVKDSWDGYGAERRELLTHVQSRNIQDVAFLTGDIHTFFAGDVGIDGRGPESVATEFVGGSITSLGIPETIQGATGAPLTPDQTLLVTRNIRASNPHLKYDEQRSRGYGVVEARDNELRVTFHAVQARPQRSTDARAIGSFRVTRGEPRVQVV